MYAHKARFTDTTDDVHAIL